VGDWVTHHVTMYYVDFNENNDDDDWSLTYICYLIARLLFIINKYTIIIEQETLD
jgi:hypothetical protein